MNGNMDGNDEIPKPYLIIMLLLKDHIFVVIVLKWLLLFTSTSIRSIILVVYES